MKEESSPAQPDEQALLKLYMELTGATEAEARAVYMHTCPKDQASQKPATPEPEAPRGNSEPPPAQA